MSDSLAKVFNVTPVEVIDSTGTSVTVPPEGAEDEDWVYARARTYELAEKGAEAMEVAMRVVKEAESPAAITALSGLIKTMSDVNKNLLVLNKDKAEAKSAKAGQNKKDTPSVQTTNNIIFSGTSKDLNKLLAEQLKGSSI